MKRSNYTGTWTLFRLFLRRDRFILPIWIILPVFLIMGVAVTFNAMAGEGMQGVLRDFDTDPLVSALLGPVMSFDLPGAVVWRGISQIALTLGIGSLLTVIRHTRSNEETGRSELIRAYIVGSHASLTATLLLTAFGNLAAGLLITGCVMALGGSAAGSFLFGATVMAIGFFFAGFGAFCAEFCETSGSARGIGITVLGLAMLLAIVNNFGGGDTVLCWITPMAWQRLTQPFTGNHFGYLLFSAVSAAIPTLLAYFIIQRRDLGSGVLPARPGRREALLHFSTPLALAWRLQKGGFFGWMMAVTLYIVAFAVISPGLSNAGGMSGWLSGLGGMSWADEVGLGYIFISVGIYLMALFVGVYAMNAVLHLKKEETEGRAEILVDKRVSRFRWMNSHLLISAGCSAALLIAMGAAGGLAYSLAAGDIGSGFWPIFFMSVSKIPPVWIMLGITALLYGLWPRLTMLGWPIWISFSLLEVAWEIQAIDWSVMALSPFSYTHYTINVMQLPLTPLFWLLGLSALLTTIGLMGFRNRDLITRA